jgi:predicted Ser/Thr protein kinase
MTNPYKHIIVRDEIPIMIDFERCVHTNKPKNITQFIQFLCKLSNILKSKDINIDTERLKGIAINYKKKNDIIYLKDILDCMK